MQNIINYIMNKKISFIFLILAIFSAISIYKKFKNEYKK
ncbi:hypothetical protein CLROS_002270 [Clostridium felsineum]|uniref:Uncharacterized protein n=1 Tax=Clostridium felsineum TaxID=36839 RepID=A0A1S8MAJ0_9CLOT|nr:hypothetical protein CLAUR_023410 [Clostridium felsineum]URZ04903.1 hypothetical protein CLROS_002270 [Clostridium felsineum]URZ09944.1 hypothetical protein CROST_006520 [Clostridium felsineum]